MATPTYALHRIRRKVTKNATTPPNPPTRAFDERKSAYRDLLEEVHILGGDLALDDLTDWVVSHVEETGSLPEPDAVSERGRNICEDFDIVMPTDSPLCE